MSIEYKKFHITLNKTEYQVYYCKGGAKFEQRFESINDAKLFIDTMEGN